MIKVCDAIMGSGKSSAAINYMNEHADAKRFLYITPFNSETIRIQESCSQMNMRIPHQGIKDYQYIKSGHLKHMLREGENIALTHSLFSMSDEETIRLIVNGEYTVFIDEAIEVFSQIKASMCDMDILCKSGMLVRTNSSGEKGFAHYEQPTDNKYTGGRFNEIFAAAKSRRLVEIDDNEDGGTPKGKLWIWSAYRELFSELTDVFVLTYMFEHSMMRCFFDINNILYDTIGVKRVDGGKFIFAEETTQPNWVQNLGNLVHIYNDETKINKIGNHKNALSVSWFSKGGEKVRGLKTHLHNYFYYYTPHIPAIQRMWGSFKNGEKHLKGKGFSKCNLAFNARASNEYSHKKALAYCVNIFQNPNMVRYLKANGVEIDEDGFALSTMLQWIWRSAIRNGEEIWIYIPSRRMRGLLEKWIEEVSREVDE